MASKKKITSGARLAKRVQEVLRITDLNLWQLYATSARSHSIAESELKEAYQTHITAEAMDLETNPPDWFRQTVNLLLKKQRLQKEREERQLEAA